MSFVFPGTSSWLFTGNEVSQILFVFFLPFARRVERRPLFLSVALMFTAVGTMLMGLPHAFGERRRFTINDDQKDLCQSGEQVREKLRAVP